MNNDSPIPQTNIADDDGITDNSSVTQAAKAREGATIQEVIQAVISGMLASVGSGKGAYEVAFQLSMMMAFTGLGE